MRTYSELMQILTYPERFAYLRIGGWRNQQHFRDLRDLNQTLYRDPAWKRVRKQVMIRDWGHDLAMEDPIYEIKGKVIVHHMNPITADDILSHSDLVWDPEYLITCSFMTHESIHYAEFFSDPHHRGDRQPNDTCPWKE